MDQDLMELKGLLVSALQILNKAERESSKPFDVLIDKVGDKEGQGIGFMPDGTMVVVEEGRYSIGSTVPVLCYNMVRNSKGRILFCKIVPQN